MSETAYDPLSCWTTIIYEGPQGLMHDPLSCWPHAHAIMPETAWYHNNYRMG